MSLYGKNARSFRKKDVQESKSKAVALDKLRFAHEATAGETGIDLGSLVVPTTMSSGGFANPSSTLLTEANLFRYKSSLTLVSSLRGALIQNASYTIASNSRIAFRGFTAEEGEFFVGVIDNVQRTGLQVIDAKVQVSEGPMADGSADFALGFETPTNRNELMVSRNGIIQRRNSNNSSTVTDGTYYIVDNGSGSGSVIRFNDPADGLDDYIYATAIGNIVQSPSDSLTSSLQVLQGQLDSIIPTVAALAGVPETDFQANPNDSDLKQFGDRVIGIENLEVELPKKIHEVRFAQDQSNFLSNTGVYHPDPADFNNTEGSGLINITESGGATRFSVTKKCKVTISQTIFVDENSGSGQLSTLIDGAPIHRTGSTRDERALDNNVSFVMSPGQELTFAMTVGFIYSIGSVSWMTMIAESLEENGRIGDLI